MFVSLTYLQEEEVSLVLTLLLEQDRERGRTSVVKEQYYNVPLFRALYLKELLVKVLENSYHKQ
jgi:hypothetical protein